jgi:lysozyme
MACTQQQAEAWLREDLAEAETGVHHLVQVPLTQGQYDALVDFTFNEGTSKLQNSTLLHLLNTGQYALAAEQFQRWDLAGGKVLPGLAERRLDEASIYEGSTDAPA